MTLLDTILDRGLVPESMLRAGIRRLLRRRKNELDAGGPQGRAARKAAWVESLRNSPLAIETQAANEQHYEVPAAFYRLVLGARLKYSSAYFENDSVDLDAAEEKMLEITCERADLKDGQRVLELGCGWGSLSLFMAQRYPGSAITALSNSASQRRFIEARAKDLGITNLEIITADINTFSIERKFDRVVSVEMFEHLRNYGELFRRIRSWLLDDGKLFFHVFTHKDAAYPFETERGDDWMGRHFFTGGQMPSDDLFAQFQDDLVPERQFAVSGTHYAKTAEAWHDRLMANRGAVVSLFDEVYGQGRGESWFQRWKIFFLACAEMFAWNGGSEWHVVHYRFAPKGVKA